MGISLGKSLTAHFFILKIKQQRMNEQTAFLLLMFLDFIGVLLESESDSCLYLSTGNVCIS
jgi:hypothetical protein